MDDLNAILEAAGPKFANVLRELATEHAQIKTDYARLQDHLDELSRGETEEVKGKGRDEVKAPTQISLAPPVLQWCSSKGSSDPMHDELLVEEGASEVAQETGQEGLSREVSSSAWTVARSRPLVFGSHRSSVGRSPSGDLTAEPSAVVLQLHQLWTESSVTLAGIHSRLTRSLTIKLETIGTNRGVQSLTNPDSCLQKMMIGPHDVKRTIWDVISILVLSVDIVMAPMMAFELPESVGLKVLNLTCTGFWTLDIVTSFLTGYHVEGAVEMRPKKVFRNYLKTWFPFDITVVLVDWLLFSSTSNLADIADLFRISKLLRFGRILRVLRLVRLLRLMKLPALLDDVSEYIHNDGHIIIFRVTRSLVTILVANHFLACGWYAVGNISTPSWIDQMDEEKRDFAFRYVSALHWSLTQFTPASMEIYPRGFPERVYTICVLFLALVVFSSFVSSITNAMNHLRQINEASFKQRSNLRRYIHENRLSLELSNRIIAFAKHLHVKTKLRVHEYEVDAFKVLPDSLRLQLHWEVYVPILSPHPFFYHCVEHLEPFVLELCKNALYEKSLTTSQELFSQNTDAKGMYFELSGTLEYYLGRSDIRCAVVSQDEWCCEVAIWLNWLHQGQLAALSHSELVVLDASIFRKLVSQTLPWFQVCQTYAVTFHERVSEMTEDDTPLDILADHSLALEISHTAFENLIHHKHGAAGSGGGRPKWRPWHTFSLIRMLTPPGLASKKKARSNTM